MALTIAGYDGVRFTGERRLLSQYGVRDELQEDWVGLGSFHTIRLNNQLQLVASASQTSLTRDNQDRNLRQSGSESNPQARAGVRA